jgi:hypothetical protein
MADTAYDADHLRQAIAAKGALAVIPNNPSRALISARKASLYPASSRGMLLLKTQAIPPSRNPLRERPPEITAPSSLSQPSSYGCDKCPRHLAFAQNVVTLLSKGNHGERDSEHDEADC